MSDSEEQQEPQDAGSQSMFSDTEMGVPENYEVLARKYRPATFADLIGQEPMVHTLTNAFAAGRIAHAFMLTGVRGVGKTTTARLLARALNYEQGDIKSPHMDLSTPGVHCPDISASRHMDVMEMDAASHTGVSDIREILDSVRYAPVSARYKVYIIDEVHMLSRSAFNALLKTLEEPPPHAIFILATTEIRKVPVTILSRCQRFDLARVDRDMMVSHLQRVCEAEGRQVSEAGLVLIARASEGSVRDALSILDQALVQADDGGEVSAEDVRTMLGLADRSRVLDLLAHGLHGKAADALEELKSQYDLGADPVVLMADMLDHCHQITRARALRDKADLHEYGSAQAQVRDLAEAHSMGELARAWQILLTAARDVKTAPNPLSAAEMALIRLCVAGGLPSPEAAAKVLAETSDEPSSPPPAPRPRGGASTGGGSSAVSQTRVQTRPAPDPAPQAMAQPEPEPQNNLPQSFMGLLEMLHDAREMDLLRDLETRVRLVRYAPGRLEYAPANDAPDTLAASLSKSLQEITGQRWLVSPSTTEKGQPTILEQRVARRQQKAKTIQDDSGIQAVMEAFPGSKITKINGKWIDP